MSVTYEQAIAKYADVQGNIIKGHGRKNATFLFVDFGTNTAGAQQWISDLLAGNNGQPQLTSTAKQLQDALKHKTDETFDGGLFASLFLSAAGYQLMGAALPKEEPNQAFGLRDEAFAIGMRTPQTKSLLKDPPFSKWDTGWLDANGQPTPIHALLLLASDNTLDKEQLTNGVKAAQQGLSNFGAGLVVQEHGKALFNAAGGGIEHFGYADGVSQPIYLTEDAKPATDSPLDTKLEAEELALVSEPGGSFGSFFVFRKLAQDVQGFQDAEGALDAELTKQAQAQGLTYTNDGGAMVVGRTEEGAPAVLSAPTDPFIPPITNNFDYSQDTDGFKCPFHAHIRKMNPRGETNDPNELHHRLTRRGIPYGNQGEKEVGLLFMCYQRNIAQQFEFIQALWANNADFINPSTGLDSIIGQGLPRPGISTPFEWGNVPSGTADFGEFVHLKGGEYFYAPSISGLRALATGATPGNSESAI